MGSRFAEVGRVWKILTPFEAPFCFAVGMRGTCVNEAVLRIVLRLVCGPGGGQARSLAAGVPRLVFGGVVAPCGLRADLPSAEGGSLIDLPLAPLDRGIRDQEVDEDVNSLHVDSYPCRTLIGVLLKRDKMLFVGMVAGRREFYTFSSGSRNGLKYSLLHRNI